MFDWKGMISYTLSGLILWGVSRLATQLTRAEQWRESVNQRLARIELKLGLRE